jgi:hypothetical protein
VRTFLSGSQAFSRLRSLGAALEITSNHMALADFGAFYSAHLLLHARVYGSPKRKSKALKIPRLT